MEGVAWARGVRVVACAVGVGLGVGVMLAGCAGGEAEARGSGGRGIEPVVQGERAEHSGGAGAGGVGGGADGSVDAATTGARLVVHPLTRVGTDGEGKPAIIVHLEVRDEFGQSIKALGVVRVELLKPGGFGVDREWVADLRSARANAQMYDDLVTRTYMLPLGGVPEWVINWSAKPGGGSGGESGGGPTVRARLVIVDDRGRERELKAVGKVGR